MTYFKQLDAIRSLAVILVILAHWIANESIRQYSLGYNGVDIFFVLSGFLITRILLQKRIRAESLKERKLIAIRNFVIRRTLRIFPVYYLFISIIYLVGDSSGTGIIQNFKYYSTYTTNLFYFFNQTWDGMLTHLWSLAVEEQFYLLWPWAMIFIPKRFLLSFLLFSLFFGIISNTILESTFLNYKYILMCTPTCYDSFSLGALLAYFMVFDEEKIILYKKFLFGIGAICLIWFVIGISFQFPLLLPRRTLISLFSLGLIIFALYNNRNIINRYVLNNKILGFLGKISYGIYLFHNIIPWLFNKILKYLELYKIKIPLVNYKVPTVISKELVFFQMFLLLILISWLSWYFIEKPINNQKIKFS